jgi:hypothetical protein
LHDQMVLSRPYRFGGLDFDQEIGLGQSSAHVDVALLDLGGEISFADGGPIGVRVTRGVTRP